MRARTPFPELGERGGWRVNELISQEQGSKPRLPIVTQVQKRAVIYIAGKLLKLVSEDKYCE